MGEVLEVADAPLVVLGRCALLHLFQHAAPSPCELPPALCCIANRSCVHRACVGSRLCLCRHVLPCNVGARAADSGACKAAACASRCTPWVKQVDLLAWPILCLSQGPATMTQSRWRMAWWRACRKSRCVWGGGLCLCVCMVCMCVPEWMGVKRADRAHLATLVHTQAALATAVGRADAQLVELLEQQQSRSAGSARANVGSGEAEGEEPEQQQGQQQREGAQGLSQEAVGRGQGGDQGSAHSSPLVSRECVCLFTSGGHWWQEPVLHHPEWAGQQVALLQCPQRAGQASPPTCPPSMAS